MLQNIEAVFEQGILRPAVPIVDLHEGQHVWLEVRISAAPLDTAVNVREANLIRRLSDGGLLKKLAAPPPPNHEELLVLPDPGLSETILAERD